MVADVVPDGRRNACIPRSFLGTRPRSVLLPQGSMFFRHAEFAFVHIWCETKAA